MQNPIISYINDKRMRRPKASCAAVLLLFILTLSLIPAPAVRASTVEERLKEQQARPIESNETAGWPAGPVVSADSAILIEAGTGTILYAKNIHQAQYPASCTKLLTCVIASERCAMDETVTMSHDAVFDTPLDSSYISLDVGNQITMEEALNAILICSANNVAFAVAEHITGTDWESFADIMNERARELGCVDSNFVNPNGLPDENHYTSAYDLAMIGRAFFDNELLSKISRTPRLHLAPTQTQPKDIWENTKNKLLPNQSMAYEYLVGSKTGYTNAARNCLVSCAEKDGLKLICVVLKDESPRQFEDTLSLFDYGFRNFTKINVSQAETKYNINTSDTFYSNNDIFGSSRPLLELNSSDYIVLPVTAEFDDTVSEISYQTSDPGQAALVTYTYNGVTVGTASIDFVSREAEHSIFDGTEETSETGSALLASGEAAAAPDSSSSAESKAPVKDQVTVINVWKVLLWTLAAIAGLAVIVILVWFIRNYLIIRARRRKRQSLSGYKPRNSVRFKRRAAIKSAKSRHRRPKRPNPFRDYDF